MRPVLDVFDLIALAGLVIVGIALWMIEPLLIAAGAGVALILIGGWLPRMLKRRREG